MTDEEILAIVREQALDGTIHSIVESILDQEFAAGKLKEDELELAHQDYTARVRRLLGE